MDLVDLKNGSAYIPKNVMDGVIDIKREAFEVF